MKTVQSSSILNYINNLLRIIKYVNNHLLLFIYLFVYDFFSLSILLFD